MPQASAGAGRPRAIARKSSAGMARLKTNTPMPRAPPGGSRSHRAKAQPHRTNAKTGMTIPTTGPINAPRAGRMPAGGATEGGGEASSQYGRAAGREREGPAGEVWGVDAD